MQIKILHIPQLELFLFHSQSDKEWLEPKRLKKHFNN